MLDRKDARRQYKETPRPAGVFAVRNTLDDRLLVGVSTDLPAMLNRQRFQLEMGVHPDKAVQADWARIGSAGFSFEVLDELELAEGPQTDVRDDLKALGSLWLERLESSGQTLYPSSRRGT